MKWFQRFFAAPQVSTGNGNRAGVPGPAGAAPFRTAWILRMDCGEHFAYCDSLYSEEEIEKKKKIAAFLNEPSNVRQTYVKVHVYLAGGEATEESPK